MIFQTIVVDRSNKDSRKKVLEDIKRRALHNINAKDGEVLWSQTFVYAEGTCTNARAIIKYKPGAFIPGVPVQPVILRHGQVRDESQPNFYRKDWINNLIYTWDVKYNMFWTFWITLCVFHSSFEVSFFG